MSIDIELLRNRAIARAADLTKVRQEIAWRRQCGGQAHRLFYVDLAAAEGAAAGALYALKLAEHDEAARIIDRADGAARAA